MGTFTRVGAEADKERYERCRTVDGRELTKSEDMVTLQNHNIFVSESVFSKISSWIWWMTVLVAVVS